MEIHDRENNSESDQHLKENSKKFSAQCLKVLQLFLDGKRLTVLSAYGYGISSLPRRVLDIKENGISVDDKWITDENGKRLHKEYFIEIKTDSQKQQIKAFIDSKTGNIYKPGVKTSTDYSKELIKATSPVQKSLF